MIRVRTLVAAFAVLGLLGLLLPDDSRQLGATSFGTVPSGHRALFELFVALGWPVARSYAPAEMLAPTESVWWVEPQGLCGEAEHEPGPGPRPERSLARFVEAGGTALVALPGRPTLFVGSATPCAVLAGLPLPPLDLPALEQVGEETLDSRLPTLDGEAVAQWVDGEVLASPRLLELSPLATFTGEPAEPWRVVARLEGRPFVLETALGRGRLAVIADASFLRNQSLDRADAAPLAVDLARRYGLDRLDEHTHGLRFEAPGALAYLAGTPALPLFASLALLGGLFFWWGSARPAPLPATPPSARAPALEGFVAPLAALYGRSRDHGRLAERYRALSLARLRRHHRLPPQTSDAQVLERLGRSGLDPTSLSRLGTPARARSVGELRRVVRRLDAVVEEGSR